MKIQNLLRRNGIIIDLKSTDKAEALTQMARFLAALYELPDPDFTVQRILEREAQMSTGIGYGIAIPHARIDSVSSTCMVAARSTTGIDFQSIDDQPVHLLFMLVYPTNTAAQHTQILSALSRIMSYEEIRTRLLNAQDSGTFCSIVTEGENKYVEV